MLESDYESEMKPKKKGMRKAPKVSINLLDVKKAPIKHQTLKNVTKYQKKKY